MKKHIVHRIVGFALLVIALAACDTATQDVEPIVSPAGYPMVTFQTSSGNTVSEGDTITYTITMDKTIDRSVTFSVNQTGGTAVNHHDYEVIPATVQPYSLEAELLIVFPLDDVPETGELTFQGEIAINSVGDKYLVNPNVVFPTLDVSLKSVNDPTLLTVMLSWDTEDDIDIVTYRDTLAGAPLEEWGDGGATGANPEIDMSLWLSDPPGTYYVSIMHWGADPFDYTFTLGYPDQSVQAITGTFDSDNLGNYIEDIWTAWGDPGYESYRILKVEIDGTSFTVTEL